MRVAWRLANRFSHDIADIDMIARLFDVLMVTHPMMSLYMSAAVWRMRCICPAHTAGEAS